MVSQTFDYTGSVQTWVVPPGVFFVTLECWGGQGARHNSATPVAEGGYVKGNLAVTPGEILRAYVGQSGGTFGNRLGGWNGGGDGSQNTGNSQLNGCGGGGASDVRQGGTALSNRKIVAAGGGGSTRTLADAANHGGFGGALTGQRGSCAHSSRTGGHGGSQTEGGDGGFVSRDGSLGQGGSGSTQSNGSRQGAGGGGGGFYGGGAGTNGGLDSAHARAGGGGSNYVGGVTSSMSQRGGNTGNGQVIITYNNPPLAPALQRPVDSIINRTQSQRFRWAFSDPDTKDIQSAVQRRYRIDGTMSWTTESPRHQFAWFIDDPPDFWSEGDWEWQASVADSKGLWGPWSDSAFFNATTPLPGPVIIAPTDSSTITNDEGLLEWSTPEQDSFQVRKVADDNGAPDTDAVYFDSGEVLNSFDRAYNLEFDTNHRWEHLQVRVKYQTFWSPWASVLVMVDYSPPLHPLIVATPMPDNGFTHLHMMNSEMAGSLSLDGSPNTFVWADHNEALDTVEDLDIQFWITPDEWPPLDHRQIVVNKRAGPSDSAWSVFIDDSAPTKVILRYRREDTDTDAEITSGDYVYTGGLMGCRVTREKTTGEIVFYKAVGLGSDWQFVSNQISNPGVDVGVSLAPVVVGAGNIADATDPGVNRYSGKVHRVEIRDEINGNLIANAEFDHQHAGGTNSFEDEYGNVWHLSGDAEYVEEPPPIGTPEAIANRVYRRLDKGPWIQIGESAPNGEFMDRTAASGIEYEYMIRAVGDNQTSVASVPVKAQLDLRFMWLHKVIDPESLRQFVYNTYGGSERWQPELSLTNYAGRILPIAEYGETEDDRVLIDVQLDGLEGVEWLRRAARSKDIYCYRDKSGRKLFGVFPQMTIDSTFYGGTVSVELIGVHYDESIGPPEQS